MNFLEKLRHKTAGLTNREIMEEAALIFKSRFIHRYRRVKTRFINPEITDAELEKALQIPSTNWLNHFRTRKTPKIFAGLENIKSTAQLHEDYFPGSFEEIILTANNICDHKFKFLGKEHQYDKKEIDWHLDTTTNYRWPSVHYSEISIAQAPRGADIKIPWELARLQHFITLGQAYQFTKDERYALEFTKQLVSFYQANPRETGIHWLCAMEVALRAVSITTAFYLFLKSDNLTDEIIKIMLKMLLSHAEFIAGNLEFSHRVTSNHYLSDLVGLLFIGMLFPEFKDAKEWSDFARTEMLKEMDKQIYDDGVDWEASIPYHAFVLEMFFYSMVLCKQQGIAIENRYWEKLEKMCNFVRAYLKPDGTAPLIGDCDNGRLFIWRDRAANDHCYLLSMAATFFEQERFKLSGQTSEESLWLFGTNGWDTYESLSIDDEERSWQFPQGGLYIMRADSLYMIVDCGDVGIKGQGSHSHNDLLSFELFYRERSFIVDPGSYIYTGDPDARNLFRSTAYHNTVMIDNIEINEIYPQQLFIIGRNAQPRVLKWQSNAEEDLLIAEHSGYERLTNPITHQREIHFNKLAGYWLIIDKFTGTGEHDYTFHFHFDVGLSVELSGLRALVMDEELNIGLAIVPIDTTGMKASLSERNVSKGYGERAKSWALVYNLRSSAPHQKRFLITPCREDDLYALDELVDSITN